MSRKFMVLMLVVFGGLLYLTSYALNKQTEPPPPPSAEQMASMKKAQESEARERREAGMAKMKAIAAERQKKHLPVPKIENPNAIPGVNLPAMPDPEVKHPRDMKTTDIRSDWMKDRQDGAEGIKKEIELREKNTDPGNEKRY